MKKIFLLIFLISTSWIVYSQSEAKVRSDESINPETDNLSGYKNDPTNLTPPTAVSNSIHNQNQSVSTNNPGVIEAQPENTGGSHILQGTAAPAPEIRANVYPNPATNYIHVELDGDNPGGVVEVLNILGQPMLQFEITGTDNMFDISTLPQGIYFVNIESGNQRVVRKIRVLN